MTEIGTSSDFGQLSFVPFPGTKKTTKSKQTRLLYIKQKYVNLKMVQFFTKNGSNLIANAWKIMLRYVTKNVAMLKC